MSSETGVMVLLIAATAAVVFGAWRYWTDGRVRLERIAHRIPGIPVADTVTLVQFSSDFCTPCAATRRLLARVADQRGVEHFDLSVEDHMDLVKQLDISRTPTVLVLDPGGEVRRRIVGVPRVEELEGLIDRLSGSEGEPR